MPACIQNGFLSPAGRGLQPRPQHFGLSPESAPPVMVQKTASLTRFYKMVALRNLPDAGDAEASLLHSHAKRGNEMDPCLIAILSEHC